MNDNIVLELKGVTKQYPGVLALDDVSVSFVKGEVHAIIGENGAGKSTLIKICTGATAPTKGTIHMNNKTYKSMTPSLSKEEGISVVYQEFNLIQELSIGENIFLGQRPKGKILYNKKAVSAKAAKIYEQFAPNSSVETPVKALSVGYQQMVEIAKALSTQVKILIMDEPSAPLTNVEVRTMFEVIGKLKDLGVTVIYISHRLDEVFQIADRVTVLRDGQYITTQNVCDTNKNDLVRYMVGRELKEAFPVYDGEISDEIVLEVENLKGNGLEDISFTLRKGEILGLGGLVGAGRTELAQLLFGAAKVRGGTISIKGEKTNIKTPEMAIKQKLVLVPEDRKRQGLVLSMSVKDNISISCIKRISRNAIVDRKKEALVVKKFKEAMRIKMSDVTATVKNLSGGNQQKVVLAKWLAVDPDIIIFDEPTRGIDVGAKYEIYLLMHELLRQGKALIMISSEMEELISMSDRIIVLSEGRITNMFDKDEFDQELILHNSSKGKMEESNENK